MSPGESKTIEVTFPTEYQAQNLAGKQATFEITAKNCASRSQPRSTIHWRKSWASTR